MTKTQTEFKVADITLSKKHPTKLTYDDLYTWVIWQFPKLKGDGLCGAVRPPTRSRSPREEAPSVDASPRSSAFAP